ncbi:MAG: glycosyltransferase [Halomonas sp.]|uniref:glycosyltransferase n=1 Tax=Halomonas sp. TaxID=1486246 RepID=UPI00287074B7|nr:glycosyltransferase [Halomonas sp.]MDR9439899.1 glycosyltransferase [Halomonas sp.]
MHSDPARELLGKKRGLARLKKGRSVRRLYNGKKVMGVSNGIVDSLERFFSVKPASKVAIHNPIEIETIRSLAKAEVDDCLPREYVVFVGRLEQRSKRFDRLLSAYRYSALRMPMVIVGEGGDKSFIESMIHRLELGGRVILLGHRDNPYPFMWRAKALLLSSDYEGFSLVLAEALACGTPVVSTDCPSGPSEILAGGLSNYLVPLDDGRQLGSALRRVVENPPDIPEDIVDDFDSERVAKRYLSLEES